MMMILLVIMLIIDCASDSRPRGFPAEGPTARPRLLAVLMINISLSLSLSLSRYMYIYIYREREIYIYMHIHTYHVYDDMAVSRVRSVRKGLGSEEDLNPADSGLHARDGLPREGRPERAMLPCQGFITYICLLLSLLLLLCALLIFVLLLLVYPSPSTTNCSSASSSASTQNLTRVPFCMDTCECMHDPTMALAS